MSHSNHTYCTDFKQISAAILAIFCHPAMGRPTRTSFDVFTPANQVISNQTYENEYIDLFGTGDHLTLGHDSITHVYDDGKLENSLLQENARLSILHGATANQIIIGGQAIMNTFGGSINAIDIKNDGMLEVFKNSHVNGAILDGFPCSKRWSMRLFDGGFANNTIIHHGLLIEEDGHLYNTIANEKPCKNHQYTIKTYGGDVVNTTLNSGSKLLVQASHNKGVSHLDKLTINDQSEADFIGLADLPATGDHITVHSGGLLNLGNNVKISNTNIHQNARLNLTQNDEIAGKTILSGNLSVSPVFKQLKNSGDLIINKNQSMIVNFPIIGNGSLFQVGSGSVILNGKNQYTGNTNIGAPDQPKQMSQLEVNGSLISPTTVHVNGFLSGTGTVAAVQNNGIIAPGQYAQTHRLGALTVKGNFIGLGHSQLNLETQLGGNQSPTDQLIIDGGKVSGHTQVNIFNHHGLGALTSNDGIEIIKGIHGADTTAQSSKDGFYLVSPVKAGAYDYRLYAGDRNGRGQNWYLRSSLRNRLPLYRPSAALLGSAANIAQNLAYTSLSTKIQRDGNIQANPRGMWARVIKNWHKAQGDGSVSPRYSGHTNGLQIGANFYHNHTEKSDQTFGLYISHLGSSNAGEGFADGQTQAVGHIKAYSNSVGLYWSHFQPSGWYSDIVAQYSHLSGHFDAGNDGAAHLKGKHYLLSYEMGKSLPMGPSIHIIPQGQIIFQHQSINAIHLPFAQVDFQNNQHWASRLGLAIKWMENPLHPYFITNWWHRSNRKNQLNYRYDNHHTDISSVFSRDDIELGVGLDGLISQNTHLYAQLNYDQGANNQLSHHYHMSFGLKYSF